MDKATQAGLILWGVAMVWMVALVVIDRMLTPKKKEPPVSLRKPIDGKRNKSKIL